VTHLRQIIRGVEAPQLRQVNHPRLHPHGGAFQSLLSSPTRSAWPRTYSRISSSIVHPVVVGTAYRNAAAGGLTFLLRAGPKTKLERR
jgi:hypothetical protein